VKATMIKAKLSTMSKNLMGIYKITYPNGKIYIG